MTLTTRRRRNTQSLLPSLLKVLITQEELIWQGTCVCWQGNGFRGVCFWGGGGGVWGGVRFWRCKSGNTEDNDFVTDADANDKDNSAPTYCFMACGAKVNSRNTHYQTSSEDESDCDSKPSYKTLAKIATEQQKAMEHIQKLLDKSDDLLDAEMTRSQSLIEDIKNLLLNVLLLLLLQYLQLLMW